MDTLDNSMLTVTTTRSIEISHLRQALTAMGNREALASLDALKGATLTLWARVNRRCAYVYDTHEHETYVVDEAGNRFSVDTLVLHQDIGGMRKDVAGSNTAQVGRTETEINMYCRRSCCAGTATFRGISWSTQWACVG